MNKIARLHVISAGASQMVPHDSGSTTQSTKSHFHRADLGFLCSKSDDVGFVFQGQTRFQIIVIVVRQAGLKPESHIFYEYLCHEQKLMALEHLLGKGVFLGAMSTVVRLTCCMTCTPCILCSRLLYRSRDNRRADETIFHIGRIWLSLSHIISLGGSI